MAKVDIRGLDKAQVLVALWNDSRMQGMSFLGYTGKLTSRRAGELIKQARHTGRNGEEEIYFDYLNGKVMKIDIAPDVIDTRLYDRDNGEGAGEAAIEKLRLALKVASGEMTYEELIEHCKDEQLGLRISYSELQEIAGKRKPMMF